jgi:hypothetical protein
METLTLDELTPAEIMALTPQEFALAYYAGQCDGCALIGACDSIARAKCDGATVRDCEGE